MSRRIFTKIDGSAKLRHEPPPQAPQELPLLYGSFADPEVVERVKRAKRNLFNLDMLPDNILYRGEPCSTN